MSKHFPVNYHISELKIIEEFSERAKNICLDNSLESLFSLIDFYKENGNFFSFRNCGQKTNDELVKVAEKYIERFKESSESDEEIDQDHQQFEELKLFCFEQFNLSSAETENFRQSFIEKRFPWCKFILMIVKSRLKDREYFIFEHNFGFFKNYKKLTLQAVGNLYKITRERVRQISHDIPFKVRELLSPFSDEFYFIDNHIHYDLKKLKDYTLIDAETETAINEAENLQCTARFYAFVFAVLYNKNSYFFQEQLLKYNNYYLLNRKLAEQFDFSEFHHDLSEKAVSRMSKNLTIDFRHYVRSFYRPGKFSYFERIVETCKQIALSEFGFKCSINDELVIPRNTKVKLSEHIQQILEEAGRPMHLKEIAEEIKTRKLRLPPSIESLRSSILTLDSIVALGKTSTYALAGWTKIKTGTIKQLAKEYIESQEHPVHVSELAKHVMKYRKTNEKNIYSNLKLDPGGAFIFFKRGFIGLSSKNYVSMGSTNGQLSLL